MARTDAMWLTVLLATACAKAPDPAVIFKDQFVTIGGHRLEMGRPVEEWETILGKGEHDRYSVLWRKYRVAGYREKNACGDDYITGAVVNLSDDPKILMPTLGAPVQIEDCVLTKNTTLSGNTLDCGTWLDFGTERLHRGRPFDFAYMKDTGNFSQMVMITDANVPFKVSQGLGVDASAELGIGLGTEGGEKYRASGACDRAPPKLTFGAKAFWKDLQSAWSSLTGD